jgi:hypothetical protein
MENLSVDCIYLLLDKSGDDKFFKLTCSSLDFLISKDDKGLCLYSSLPRFLFGIKIGKTKLCICTHVAKGGHLEVLKYAHENGCPWSLWVCAYAAEGGHLEVLKYAHENG